MTKTLIIVESPNKTKKIEAFLGAGYRVVASVGHIRDLPERGLGVEPPNFWPEYVETERGKQVVRRLKADVAEADHIFLATDPDREGEAIAWHLAEALNLKNPDRITFNAITKEKVLEAMKAARKIDMDMVRSQEARRSLDRIVGYRVSPVLCQRAGQNLSAGRVQSPALRLVVDREREIINFKSVKHYGAELIFPAGEKKTWHAEWNTKPHLSGDDAYVLDKALAERAANVRQVQVTEYSDSDKGRAPYAPFTTSTLQQAASQRLKIRPKETMQLAQKLYEQGAITYHRTDAPNMDAAGVADIKAFAESEGLALAPKPRVWKAKESAQEGHEAIRPTHAADKEAGETDQEKALYRLIWQRAVASQLADAIYAVRAVTLEGKTANDEKVTFSATGRTLKNPGWMVVYGADEDDTAEAESNNPIPMLTVGENVEADSGRVLSKETKPKPRFTEATLVRELEKQGIGRPSTYASILENIIQTRGYMSADKKGYLIPTDTGAMVRDELVGTFSFAELDFTRTLEERLDDIAAGKAPYKSVVADAWGVLDGEIAKLAETEAAPLFPCPECGKALTRRKGKYGFFWSCTGYPECKASFPDSNGKPGEKKPKPPTSGIACPKCGSDLIRRKGISKPKKRGEKGKPYDFYGCSGFPKCDASYQTKQDGSPDLDSGK